MYTVFFSPPVLINISLRFSLCIFNWFSFYFSYRTT